LQLYNSLNKNFRKCWCPLITLGRREYANCAAAHGQRVEVAAKQIFSRKKKFSALKNFKIFSQIEAKSLNMFFKVYNFC